MRFIVVLLVIVALLAGASALPHFGMTMSMDEHGNMLMSDCYMPGVTALCNMTPTQHIAAWQSMFTGILNVNTLLFLLALLLTILGVIWWNQYQYVPPEVTYSRAPVRRRGLPRITLLQELFSGGILHPKVF